MKVTAACVCVYLLACTFTIGGFIDDRPWGNGSPFYYSLNVLNGQVPYRDFSLEYPPLALPVFLAPHLFAGDGLIAYNNVFKVEMALFGLGALFLMNVVLRRLRATELRRALALGAFAVSPALLGHLFLNRYDLWPTLLVTAALASFVTCRVRTGGAATGAAIGAKAFALVTVPVAALRLRGSVRLAAVWAAAVLIATFGYFAVVAPHGLGASFKVQLTRHLQTESVGASLLLAADQVGIYHARIVAGNPGSIDLAGGLPDAIGVISSVVLLAAVALIVMLYRRCGPEDDEAFIAAFAASVFAFAVLTKVISPQFLIWVLPLVPLVRGRAGALASVLLLAALPLTQSLNYGFSGLTIAGWTVWVLLLRNALLLGSFAVLIAGLLRMSAAATAPTATTAPPM